VFKPLNAAMEKVTGLFGLRVAHDVLRGDAIERANRAVAALSAPFDRPTVKRDVIGSAMGEMEESC